MANHDSKQLMTNLATINLEVMSDTAPAVVFLSGNHDNLGNWDAAGVQLDGHQGRWHKALQLPKDTWIEFKLTDGTWDTEAAMPETPKRDNYRFYVEGDSDLTLEVNEWLNNDPSDPVLGDLQHHGHFSGEGINDREVVVWLPSEYQNNPDKHYPVLYMHDGQNICDPATAFMNNDWRVDESIERLSAEGRIDPPIVVGMYNTVDRLDEYNDTELGRHYLNFIVDVVKPFVDSQYRTLPDKHNTATMGSSMGGLISFLAAWYHPDVFGHAACLSPMFWGKNQVNVKAWQMVENTPEHPLEARIYMDNGTMGVERALMPGCKHMLRVLREQRGYRDNHNLLWVKDEGALHNEPAWADRLWQPLEFLYKTA